MRTMFSNITHLFATAAHHQPRAVVGGAGLALVLTWQCATLLVRQHGL